VSVTETPRLWPRLFISRTENQCVEPRIAIFHRENVIQFILFPKLLRTNVCNQACVWESFHMLHFRSKRDCHTVSVTETPRLWPRRFFISDREHQCIESRIAIFHRWYTNSIHPISKVHLSKGTHTIDDILMCDIE